MARGWHAPPATRSHGLRAGPARAPARPLRLSWRVRRRAHGQETRRLVSRRPARGEGIPRPLLPDRDGRGAAGRDPRAGRSAGPPIRRSAGLRPETRGMSRNSNSIDEAVTRNLERYFRDLEGARPRAVYDMVIQAVERPMLEVVMRQAQGNQLRASEMLGINRNTLRKKLINHGLLGQ